MGIEAFNGESGQKKLAEMRRRVYMTSNLKTALDALEGKPLDGFGRPLIAETLGNLKGQERVNRSKAVIIHNLALSRMAGIELDDKLMERVKRALPNLEPLTLYFNP